MSVYEHIGDDWIAVTDAFAGDWEWSSISVWYSPSARRYFWYSDAGCSCNSYGDHMDSASEFQDGDRTAALDAVSGYDDTERARARIRDFSVPTETY